MMKQVKTPKTGSGEKAMKNVYLDLPLPINVRINFSLFQGDDRTSLAAARYKKEAVTDVLRAVNLYLYTL